MPVAPGCRAEGTNTAASTTVMAMMAPVIWPMALRRRGPRIQALFIHDAFDVFDHHDGIVHHDADREDHAEQRQLIDREVQRGQPQEGSEQGDGNHQRRNDGGAYVLQEDQHDHEHQRDRLGQRLRDIGHGGGDEGGGVVGNGPAHSLRQILPQEGHLRFDRLGDRERVGAGQAEKVPGRPPACPSRPRTSRSSGRRRSRGRHRSGAPRCRRWWSAGGCH